MLDSINQQTGLARRLRAIAIAGDDVAVGVDARAAALAAIGKLSVAELQDLADAHILFADHAPPELMVNFLLRQRLATELLGKMGSDSKPYPIQPETLEIGGAGQPPKLGSYQPPPPYRVRTSRRSKAPAKPAFGR